MESDFINLLFTTQCSWINFYWILLSVYSEISLELIQNCYKHCFWNEFEVTAVEIMLLEYSKGKGSGR